MKRIDRWMVVKAFGIGTMLGCFLTMMLTFILSTFNGLDTGNYRVVVYTNLFSEHYFEIGFLIFGFICYIVTINKPIKEKDGLRR